MQKSINAISILVLVAMILLTVGAFATHYWLNQPLALKEDRVISVNNGDTLGKIAYQLSNEGVLTFAKGFITYARLTDKTQVETGEYRLTVGSTPLQLIELLQSGDVVSYSVTLIEGKTFKEYLARLQSTPKIVSTLGNKTTAQALAALNINVDHYEGWFFPDTYRFVSGTTDKDVLLQAHKKTQKILAQEWANKAKNLPYKNAYEALIMASIIEKETGVAYERAEIAGVFVRRLQKGMRLQTDPTIIYGLGDRYKGNIRRKHLREKTAYNTYVINGLPPTPIAMPGREAIHAALHPKPGKALFFVAKGDGSHYFSATLAEHNKAVQKYQIKKRKKNYQSAPKSP